jgi:protein gp37
MGAPLTWDQPGAVVLGSLCDLFHPRVDPGTIAEVLGVVASTPWLTYRLLTKRAKRMLQLGNEGLVFPSNLWLGVSVESDEFAWRAEDLLRVNTAHTWVAVEPMLGPVPSLTVPSLGWVVCAPETGPDARTLQIDWVRGLRDMCLEAGVPFRYGSLEDHLVDGSPDELPLLDGRVWDQAPFTA